MFFFPLELELGQLLIWPCYFTQVRRSQAQRRSGQARALRSGCALAGAYSSATPQSLVITYNLLWGFPTPGA